MKNIWKEKKFVKKIKLLNRNHAYKLYPSESWAILSTLTECKNILDVGCGDGNKFKVLKKLNNKIKYTGIDLNSDLIKIAKKKYKDKNTQFFSMNINEDYKSIKKRKYDLIMGWAFFYCLENYKEIIKNLLLNNCKKYLIFDLRMANIKKDIIDKNKSFTFYKNKKNRDVYVISSINSFKNFLNSNFKEIISECLMTGYIFPPSKNVVIEKNLCDTYIVSIIIKKGRSKNKINFDIKLPL